MYDTCRRQEGKEGKISGPKREIGKVEIRRGREWMPGEARGEGLELVLLDDEGPGVGRKGRESEPEGLERRPAARQPSSPGLAVEAMARECKWTAVGRHVDWSDWTNGASERAGNYLEQGGDAHRCRF